MCQYSELFPDVIELKLRLPGSPAETVVDDNEVKHQRDVLYTRLSSVQSSPNFGLSSHLIVEDYLKEYIQFCKLKFSLFHFPSKRNNFLLFRVTKVECGIFLKKFAAW